jgi:GT2 family glycosyltransferase
MFEKISFVIPTVRSEITTLDSVPRESEIIIVNGIKPLGRARNFGIDMASKDWIALCDDDISFSRSWLRFVCSLARKDRIIGLEAYWPSPFVIGRFMFFHRNAFYNIGYFAEKAHGDETEWCYRALKKGYEIVRLPRQSVKHIPHKRGKKNELANLLWLCTKHPDFPIYLLREMLLKLRYSSPRDHL